MPRNISTGTERRSDSARGANAYDVLVLDGAVKQSLRSAQLLGRAGLRVAIGESSDACPERPDNLPAFRSRYCARRVVFPSFTRPTEFADAVIEFVRKHPTSVVLPTNDATIAILYPRRADFDALGTVLALAPDAALEVANHKDRTLEVASELGIGFPRSVLIKEAGDLKVAIAELGFPLILKPTFSWLGEAGKRVSPVDVLNESEAEAVTREFLDDGASILAQEYAGGLREEVTLLIVDGEAVVSFAHVEPRNLPQIGGVSVIRESVLVPHDILDSAIRLAKAIGLEGPCGIEFRRDAANRPLLMEINARLGGALETSVRSGINLPLMVWQWAMGESVPQLSHYRVGVRTRWLEGDIRWLFQNFRRVGRLDSVSRIEGLWLFVSEFARSRYYDYFDLRDLKPAVADLRNIAAGGMHSFRRRATRA
jgi:predicted ATP-grasp superfamily ATP-dependent carboligase